LPLSDETLVRWVRREATDGLDDRDIALSSDVYSWMPLLYYVSRYSMIGGRPPGALPVFLEIGTADGSTALPLVKAAAELGGHLHSVDPSHGGCERAHELVDHFGYRAHWTHHEMPSDLFFATHPGFRCEFVLIDGDHAWPQVRRDVLNSWQALWPGGLIWVSDYDPLYEGHLPYEDEGLRVARVGDQLVDQPLYDAQCTQGIAKALRLVLPDLGPLCSSLQLRMHPNPSILLRKRTPGEVLF
jgi:predicted O-methyltransferase YrrM